MFYAGQKVVCVVASGAPELRRGGIYTVNWVDAYRGGKFGLELLEVEPPRSYRGWLYKGERFRPVVERKTDISVFQEMLTKRRVSV